MCVYPLILGLAVLMTGCTSAAGFVDRIGNPNHRSVLARRWAHPNHPETGSKAAQVAVTECRIVTSRATAAAGDVDKMRGVTATASGLVLHAALTGNRSDLEEHQAEHGPLPLGTSTISKTPIYRSKNGRMETGGLVNVQSYNPVINICNSECQEARRNDSRRFARCMGGKRMAVRRAVSRVARIP